MLCWCLPPRVKRCNKFQFLRKDTTRTTLWIPSDKHFVKFLIVCLLVCLFVLFVCVFVFRSTTLHWKWRWRSGWYSPWSCKRPIRMKGNIIHFSAVSFLHRSYKPTQSLILMHMCIESGNEVLTWWSTSVCVSRSHSLQEWSKLYTINNTCHSHQQT